MVGKNDLRIACPAQTFCAVRAVGENIHEVAVEAPFYIVLQLVDEWIGTAQNFLCALRLLCKASAIAVHCLWSG
jgi:hypothetical protein